MVTNMYLINYSQNEIEQIVILEKIGLLWKPSFFDPLNTSALKVVVQKKMPFYKKWAGQFQSQKIKFR